MAILKIINKKYSINDVENVVNYILRYDKKPIFNTNLLYLGSDYKANIIQQFKNIITYYNKTSSASCVLHHIIISFDYMEECYVDKADALNIMNTALLLLSFNNDHISNYQYLYSLHQDSSNIHIHLVINSICPLTGRMINVNKTFIQTLQYNIALILNRIKREHKELYLKNPFPDDQYYCQNDILTSNKPAVVTVVYD